MRKTRNNLAGFTVSKLVHLLLRLIFSCFFGLLFIIYDNFLITATFVYSNSRCLSSSVNYRNLTFNIISVNFTNL